MTLTDRHGRGRFPRRRVPRRRVGTTVGGAARLGSWGHGPGLPDTRAGVDAADYGVAVAVVDDLLSNPGLYLGIDTVVGTDHRGAARIVVTPLPGGSGVTLDYEVLNPAMPEGVRGHLEHTVVARTDDGSTLMLIGHTHAETLTVLRETTPGTFEVGPEGSPYPMKVELSVPEPGRLRHVWWYGRAGGEAEARDVSELTRAD